MPLAARASSEAETVFALARELGLSPEEQRTLWNNLQHLQDLVVPHEEFYIWADPQAGMITLQGDLDGSDEAVFKIDESLFEASRMGIAKWTIRADQARIYPPGIESWIEAVGQYLENCELLYKPSQLGLVLRYDDEYQHKRSVIEDL